MPIFSGGCSCPFLLHTQSDIYMVNMHKSKAEIDNLRHNRQFKT